MASSKKLTATRRTTESAWSLPVPATLLWMLAIFGLAFLPRVLPWGTIVTVDEAYHWFNRAAVFLRAVQNGAYADTNLVGHPGVTTMWLGSLGILLQRALVDGGWATYENAALYRGLLRLPVVLTTSLGVALAYPLLLRLLDRRVALLGALLWAADPFLIAHSQLLHLDALLASFMTLSLLAALASFWRNNTQMQESACSWPLLIASGIAAGLAVLTKSPSIVLLPMVGLIALVGALRRQAAPSLIGRLRTVVEPQRLLHDAVVPLLAWIGVAAFVWFALWPAAWVDLLGAVGRVVLQARDDGGAPHAWGNFFLGQAVADPGPLFYPVAIALRLSPWALVGCLAALFFGLRRDWSGLRVEPLALVAFFALMFIIAMSMPPKKFDRYVLPVFPALDLLAAAGLVRLGESLTKAGTEKAGGAIVRRSAFGFRRSSFVVLLIIPLIWYYPYYLSYYNPLLGGGPVAARLIPIGWGEGYEQVAAYIAAQPDGGERPVATWFPPVLSRFLPTEVGPLAWAAEPGKVDYAVLYIDQIQRNDEPEVTALLQNSLTPIHTVRIHGIDYAAIYRIPPPVARPVAATFGEGITLRGYDADTSALRATGTITLTFQWQATADVTQDYLMFVHILDAQGERVGQADIPPGGAQAPSGSWRTGRYLTLVQPVPARADLPPGRYWIAVGIYDQQSFARLPLRAGPPPADAPGDGPDALVIGPVEIGP